MRYDTLNVIPLANEYTFDYVYHKCGCLALNRLTFFLWQIYCDTITQLSKGTAWLLGKDKH